ALPPGYSSPILTETSVIVTAVDGTKLLTIALEKTTGEERWRRAAPEELEKPHEGVNSPAAPTPVAGGEDVYVFFERFGLIAYDAEGNERWTFPLGPFKSPYGLGASPILVDDTVVLL